MLAGLVVLGLACNPGFHPESLVDSLRVLAVEATPPDLRPGETSRLRGLILDPSRPGQAVTVLWLGCDPDPFNLNRSVCSNPDLLNDPATFTGGAGELPAGVHVIGLNGSAAYKAAPDVFSVLSADDVRRQTGTAGLVLALSVAEAVSPAATPEELQALLARVRNKEVRSLLTLFRVHISESSERNTNPVLKSFTVGGEPWPAGAAFLGLPGEPVVVDAEATPETFEQYTDQTSDGPVRKTERILVSWYTTSGEFSEVSTALNAEVKTKLRFPAGDVKTPFPDSRRGSLYVVARDTRGGMSWKESSFFVCDSKAAEPNVTRIEVSPTGTVTASGDNLASVVDLIIDGEAVSGGFDSNANQWIGRRAPLAAGRHSSRIHAKTCTRTTGPEIVQ